MKASKIWVIIALLIFTPLVFANGNHEQNSHHEDKTYTNEYISESTYIEYKGFSEAIAAQAALSSIPALSHRHSKHSHSGIGFGAGYYEGHNGLAFNIQNQTDCISLEANFAFSGKEKIYGLGATISF